MEFSKRLKHFRNQRKMSVADISMKAGVAQSSYQEWEQGRRILDVEVYFKLAKALDVTPGELIRGSNQRKELQMLIDRIDHIAEELKVIKTTLLSGEF